jgi:Ni/Co efflux regulator RcnB
MQIRRMMHAGAFALSAMSVLLASQHALADKPEWAGNKGGKGQAGEQRGDRDSERRPAQRGHFDDDRRVVVREYYGKQHGAGRCPPGLAKKNNGCMPPGQAKRWQVGQQLPRDVVIYDVPRSLVLKIGQPPAGHKYVRVAADILLIAIGTSMVVDAIEDLGR